MFLWVALLFILLHTSLLFSQEHLKNCFRQLSQYYCASTFPDNSQYTKIIYLTQSVYLTSVLLYEMHRAEVLKPTSDCHKKTGSRRKFQRYFVEILFYKEVFILSDFRAENYLRQENVYPVFLHRNHCFSYSEWPNSAQLNNGKFVSSVSLWRLLKQTNKTFMSLVDLGSHQCQTWCHFQNPLHHVEDVLFSEFPVSSTEFILTFLLLWKYKWKLSPF